MLLTGGESEQGSLPVLREDRKRLLGTRYSKALHWRAPYFFLDHHLARFSHPLIVSSLLEVAVRRVKSLRRSFSVVKTKRYAGERSPSVFLRVRRAAMTKALPTMKVEEGDEHVGGGHEGEGHGGGGMEKRVQNKGILKVKEESWDKYEPCMRAWSHIASYSGTIMDADTEGVRELDEMEELYGLKKLTRKLQSEHREGVREAPPEVGFYGVGLSPPAH